MRGRRCGPATPPPSAAVPCRPGRRVFSRHRGGSSQPARLRGARRPSARRHPPDTMRRRSCSASVSSGQPWMRSSALGDDGHRTPCSRDSRGGNEEREQGGSGGGRVRSHRRQQRHLVALVEGQAARDEHQHLVAAKLRKRRQDLTQGRQARQRRRLSRSPGHVSLHLDIAQTLVARRDAKSARATAAPAAPDPCPPPPPLPPAPPPEIPRRLPGRRHRPPPPPPLHHRRCPARCRRWSAATAARRSAP